jgi:hypothetical protein
MPRTDRKRRLDRYDALLARQGDVQLLNSFDALIRAMSVKKRRRAAPKGNGSRRDRAPPP